MKNLVLGAGKKVIVKKYASVQSLDGRILTVYIVGNEVQGIYHNYETEKCNCDRSEFEHTHQHSDKLNTKSIKSVFGVTRKELFKMIDENLESEVI